MLAIALAGQGARPRCGLALGMTWRSGRDRRLPAQASDARSGGRSPVPHLLVRRVALAGAGGLLHLVCWLRSHQGGGRLQRVSK